MELSTNPVRQTNRNLPAQHRRLRDLRDDHRANRQNALRDLPIPPFRPQRIAQPTNLRVNNVGILPTGQENIPPRDAMHHPRTPLRQDIMNHPWMQQGPNVDAEINNRQNNLYGNPVVGVPATRQHAEYHDLDDLYSGGSHHKRKGKKSRRRRKSNKR